MTRRRTDDHHRGDARGLARDGNQSVVPDHFGGRPLDEGADAHRGPAATAWSTSSSLGCRRTTRWTQIFARHRSR